MRVMECDDNTLNSGASCGWPATGRRCQRHCEAVMSHEEEDDEVCPGGQTRWYPLDAVLAVGEEERRGAVLSRQRKASTASDIGGSVRESEAAWAATASGLCEEGGGMREGESVVASTWRREEVAQRWSSPGAAVGLLLPSAAVAGCCQSRATVGSRYWILAAATDPGDRLLLSIGKEAWKATEAPET
ncbi:hypothetical protein ZIOFF_044629 [Zingiber officinale]|uniref:Uncharacterized protein n=1 Tax=Zingiber officinale TaxID=94328 RepID=A0A8J5GC60_ZINOF|nr:hypothetical protein ZIOFF_044629 [Zingiber officinale]